jgi:hypothetical protein
MAGEQRPWRRDSGRAVRWSSGCQPLGRAQVRRGRATGARRGVAVARKRTRRRARMQKSVRASRSFGPLAWTRISLDFFVQSRKIHSAYTG